MKGTIIFEDDLICNKNHKFEVNLDNGDIAILYKNNEKINLGKYPLFESLPTNSILYDVKVIPEIKNLHEWLITKYEDIFTFLNVKDLLIKDLSNTNDFESILKTIKRYNERIEIEIRNDDVIF